MENLERTNLKNLELLHTRNRDFYFISIEEMMELVKFLNRKSIATNQINFFEYKFVEELKSNQENLKVISEYLVRITATPIDPIFQQFFMAEEDWFKMCLNCDSVGVLNEKIEWSKIRWQTSDKITQLKSVENMVYLVYETMARSLKQKPEIFSINYKKLSSRRHLLDPRILSSFCFDLGMEVEHVKFTFSKSPAQLLGIKNQFDTDRNTFLDEVSIHLEKKWLDLEKTDSVSTTKIKVL